LSPPCGFTATTCDDSWANSPQPWPKKSPSGTSTAGSASPSQCIRSSRLRQFDGCVVIQMCCTVPGPSISARQAVVPAGTSIEGETFQPRPRSRAASAPVPSVAPPPAPGAPVGFSGLIERVTAELINAISGRSGIGCAMGPPGLVVSGRDRSHYAAAARAPGRLRSTARATASL
jgi:hypothetical protein